jgi:polar amino acid transport system substrate-binding protein
MSRQMKHRTNQSLSSWLAALLMNALLLASVSASELPTCSRPFSLAFHDHGLLYSKTTQKGIDKDIADELIRRSGCAFNVSVMPRARIWRWIESGELDFSMSGISTDARETYAGFAWYLFNKYYFLVRKDAQVSSLEAFERDPQLKVGNIRSFRYSKNVNLMMDKLKAQGRITEVADHEQLLAMLKLGRIQAMVIEPFNYSQVESRELAGLTRILEIGDPAVLHGLIMSKKALPESEQKKWRALVDDMRADGTLLAIMRKYFSEEDARAFTSF